MPLLSIHSSATKLSNEQDFLREISIQISQLTGKPEDYVMTKLVLNVPMTFAGSNEPCALIEFKAIGSFSTSLLSEPISKIISDKLSIPLSRIYISFEEVAPRNWGFNGRTFG